MVNGGNNARLEGAPFTPFYGAKVPLMPRMAGWRVAGRCGG
jgi:hypothetical protein